MSKYQELLSNPVKNTINGLPKRILIDLVSVMCDNPAQISFELSDDKSYIIRTGKDAFTNFQIECTKSDLIWEAEDGKWDTVIQLINSGTSKISKIRTKF